MDILIDSLIAYLLNIKKQLCSHVSIALKQVCMNLLLLKTNQSLIEESTNTSRVYSGSSFYYELHCST